MIGPPGGLRAACQVISMRPGQTQDAVPRGGRGVREQVERNLDSATNSYNVAAIETFEKRRPGSRLNSVETGGRRGCDQRWTLHRNAYGTAIDL